MLNKINTLLTSAIGTTIKEIKTTAYPGLTGQTSNFIILPAGITQGSLGLLLIGSTRGTSANNDVSELGIPTGFTLIDKLETRQGDGRNASQGLFYKYMTASDSSTTISTLFANSRSENAVAIFIEVILNKNINIQGFDDLINLSSGTTTAAATLTNVPSVITGNSPFFLLTCGLAGGGGGYVSGVLTGGMQLYDTSETILSVGSTTNIDMKLLKYDNILIKDLPSTEDAIFSVIVGGTGHASAGVYIIWLK